MADLPYGRALIVGTGPGISASLARRLTALGVKVGLAARDTGKLAALAAETGAITFAVDGSNASAVAALFDEADRRLGEPDIVLYNASARAHGPIVEIDPVAVERALAVTAFGGFLVVQQAAKRMAPRGGGAILLTGATASVKGFALSSAFAMGKFALRGLAQSAARELGPKGIHLAHFVIDGAVRGLRRPDPPDKPDSTLDPDAIAQAYIDTLRQPRSAWSLEVEVRPWVENFWAKTADAEKTLAELQDRIGKTVAYLATFKPSQFDGSAERSLPWTWTASRWRFFHVTTPYDTLRHKGLQIGKIDYLGAFWDTGSEGDVKLVRFTSLAR